MSLRAPILLAFTLLTAALPAFAQGEKLRQETILSVKARLVPLLEQYCRDACTLIDVDAVIEEQLGVTDDLGFEGLTGEDAASLAVSKILVQLQVDDRVTAVNRDRLSGILQNGLAKAGAQVEIAWRPVTLPQIGQSAAKEEQLKRQLQARVAQAVDKVIDTYCPEACVLSQVIVDGKLVTADEAANAPTEELVRDKSGDAVLKIDGIDVAVAMDTALSAEARSRIAGVMKAKTRFASPLEIDVEVAPFPESFARQQERQTRASRDPFGLEQLRQTLRIFRELAGTKEIVTNTSATEKGQSTSSNTAGPAEGTEFWEKVLALAALLLVGGMVLLLVLRFGAASREAKMMMAAAETSKPQREGAPERQAASGPRGDDDGRRTLATRARVQEVKDELIKVFLDAPRVAKETFSRLLQEEGIEETARYVHLFGHLVIFELLGDPNLQRDLYELSEYYHKSSFDFTPEEELKQLLSLKTRVTASEIRVMTRRQMDKFDFLQRLDSTQIFNLIAEEKPQLQSIVLTQLDHKRRRAVFDMYQGEAKVDLMRELCRADAIPKEYLSNVAKALHKKVVSRPEFDTENLRSSDILLDLLEKADLAEQRALMANLLSTNPDAARGIKLKLVTVEALPYLKDGHLLEIILGLEREEMLTFLTGTREHIKALILAKAPDELSEAWLEDLANVRGLDEQAYRLVELKVLGRIRALANNGAINLLDLNDMIFAPREEDGSGEAPKAVIETPPEMVA